MENSQKTELSVKLTFIQKNHETTGSNFYNNDEITTNQHSKENQVLNEKIFKYNKNRPLLSFKTIKKLVNFNFTSQYSKNKFNSILINRIVHNERGHIVAEFKDFLICGDLNEFLQKYYKLKEINFLLPKIYEYYIYSSVIFPNYIKLPESRYIYRNIQRKQKVIDAQQEQEDKEEKIKKGLIKKEKREDIFTTQIVDSILNQTDTSGIKKYFEINTEGNSLEMSKLNNIIKDINICETKALKNKNSFHKNYLNKQYSISIKSERSNNDNNMINLKDTVFQKENRNIKYNNKKKDSNLVELKNKNFKNLEIDKIIPNNNTNKNFKPIKKNNALNKKANQLSKSIKYINELTLNKKMNNGNLLKNIYSRNKGMTIQDTYKNKQIENRTQIDRNKEHNNKGRNCLRSSIQINNYNDYYNTTNDINKAKIIKPKYTKSSTSRQFYKLDQNKEILNIIYINDDLKNKKNSIISSEAFNSGEKKIIKKSILDRLLYSDKNIETEDNSTIIKNKRNKKNSFNRCILDTIAKNTFYSERNKNQNDNKNGYIKGKKGRNHIFCGFTNKDNNLVDKSQNKLFNSCSRPNINKSSYRTINKNYSSYNITNGINFNASNLSYSLKNKYRNEDYIKILRKENKNINVNKIKNERNLKNKKTIVINNYNNKRRQESIKSYTEKSEGEKYLASDKDNYEINQNNNLNKNENHTFKNYKSDFNLNSNKSLNSSNYITHHIKNINSKISNKKEVYSNQETFSDKKLQKILSERNIYSPQLIYSPNNSNNSKKFNIKSDFREKQINYDIEKTLTLRDTIYKNTIYNEKIEMLSKKINEMKRNMKENKEKNINSLSHIFKDKKMKKKNITSSQNTIRSKNFEEKIKHRMTNIQLNDAITEVTIKNIDMSSNLNNKKRKIIYQKKNLNVNRKQFMSNDDIFNNNNNQETLKNFRSNSNSNFLIELNDIKVNNISKNNLYKNNEYNTQYNFNIKRNNQENDSNQINIDIVDKNSKDNKLLNSKMKSVSLKFLPTKKISKKNTKVKGIYGNELGKILNKKNNSRNMVIPICNTERFRNINVSSFLNNSKRYINNTTTSNNKARVFQKKLNEIKQIGK